MGKPRPTRIYTYREGWIRTHTTADMLHIQGIHTCNMIQQHRCSEIQRDTHTGDRRGAYSEAGRWTDLHIDIHVGMGGYAYWHTHIIQETTA